MKAEQYLARLERMMKQNEQWLGFAALRETSRKERLAIREEILLLASRMTKFKGV